MVRSLEAELNRHITGGEIDDAARDEERRDAARALLLQGDRGIGNPLDAADAGSDHHAGGDLVFIARRLPAGMFDRLARRAHRVDDEVIDPALLLRLHPLIGIVGAVRAVAARNGACDFRREILDVECLDSARSALAREQTLPRVFDTAAERRHHAEPRDNHTPHAGSLPLNFRAGEPSPTALSGLSKPDLWSGFAM